jgi:hypothetical protein
VAGTRIPWSSFVVAIVAACGGADGERAQPVGDSRVVTRAGVDFRSDATTAERFGLSKSAKTHTAAANPGSEAATPFAWTCPPGWTEVAPTSMRVASFRPAGDPHAECYLTLLSGDAGGLGANVNRWRAQLGLAALGRASVLLEASGTWKGMNGNEAAPGWGLAGLLLVEPGGSAFLKMTGPAKLVVDERENLLALAKSFRAAKPADEAAKEQAAAETGGAGFAWVLPEGWRRAPDKPMRAASFFVGAGEALECYVTVFPGEAGGMLANVNRWRGQIDLPPLEEAEIATLESIPMLGRKAVVVEGEGKGTKLVGAACPGSERSVFVKMSGPPELVKEQRGAFLAFCMSLEEGK